MTSIRLATTPEDRRAVVAVAHAATQPADPPLWYAAGRLSSGLRARADWWLLEEDGRPVCSLLSYPLRFVVDGEAAPGFGVGSVTTIPEARKRGHASALCRHVIQAEAARGRACSLLYSAIPPLFYERMGYRVAPGWSWSAEDLCAVADSGPRAALVPLDPRVEQARLIAAWRRGHPGPRMLRDPEAWAENLALNPADLFFAVGSWGYARVGRWGQALDITELFCEDPDAAVRALCALAAEMGLASAGCWLAPCPVLEQHFTPKPRDRTLPMVLGLPPEGARFWSSDYF